MKWATFTGAFPGVDVTVGHYRPRGLVSWTWAIDPYTFYVPQITIAAKREPFEIDQFGRVETLSKTKASLFALGAERRSVRDSSHRKDLGGSPLARVLVGVDTP